MRKALVVSGIVGTVGLAGLASAASVSAATDTSKSGDPMSSLVDKIASKFNLDKSKVQAVFDEDRAAHQAERQQEMKDRLATAVKDGKLTQAQADMITAKQAEMKTFMDSLKGKTGDERHQAMEAKRDELKKWASESNIPQEYLGPAGHGRGPGGPR